MEEEREHRVFNDMRRTFSPIKKKKKKKESSFLGKGGASTISEFNLDPMNNLNNGGGVLRKFLAL